MEGLDFLIDYLLKEEKRFAGMQIPCDKEEKRRLFRALCNMRMPRPVSGEFLRRQDEYLQNELKAKGVVGLSDIELEDTSCSNIKLWQGDITRLSADAIVNAANSQLLGCFYPLHACIDNAIHSAAGVQLRNECNDLMNEQGYPEPTGSAKITEAYNLPCRYVIHTVGPIIHGNRPTEEECTLLKNCYLSCLDLALNRNLKSIAFCCISTGEFHFPNQSAAEIAYTTVRDFVKTRASEMTVVFNVFKDTDFNIYKQLLNLH
ncbi:MAG: protein-ADP-ribose hydrolase [Bacteroidales bacterium]|nr:protein-ADP-ribose hydrolase [Bacteroidales bacterium]